MPRTKEDNLKVRESQTKRILEAAMKTFAQKGLSATMAEVAEEAGVSYGILYHYYKNKEAIVNEIVKVAMSESVSAHKVIANSGETPGERIRLLVSGLIEYRFRTPNLYQLLYQIQNQINNGDSASPEFVKLAIRNMKNFEQILNSLIAEGQTSGEVRDGNPEQMVTAVMAVLDGLTRLSMINPKRFLKSFPDSSIILNMILKD